MCEEGGESATRVWGARPGHGSLDEIPHDAEGGAPVSRSKMIPVVQVVKELIQTEALLKATRLGDVAVVGRVEGAAKAPKHASYCQLVL